MNASIKSGLLNAVRLSTLGTATLLAGLAAAQTAYWPQLPPAPGYRPGLASVLTPDLLPPDTTPTGSIRRATAARQSLADERPAGAADLASLLAGSNPSNIDPMPTGSVAIARKSTAAIEPELPPDAPAKPPTLADLSPAPPAAPPAATAEGSPAPPATLTPDALADALSAMVDQKSNASPVGDADWSGARETIRAYYAARQFAPMWVAGDHFTPAARAAIEQIAKARADGLNLAAFALPGATDALTGAATQAHAEVTLSEAIAAYALQASGGRIVPTRISPLVTARPDIANPAAALAAVFSASDPAAALAAFNPPQKGYRDLRDQLALLRAAGDGVTGARIPPGPPLKIGMVDARVALIRARFNIAADDGASGPLVYDRKVASAVESFQRINGLEPNGVLTAGTAAALSGGETARQRALIVANMEMWRWEPRDMGDTRIEVNVPDFSLRLMRGGDVVHSARVIVGKPLTPTPIFSNAVRYLLVNPVWHVPDSIIKKEMMPKLAKDPDYLTRQGFEVTQNGDQLIVSQPAGERNALGHILFMFPNEHSVYLHDTPSRGLFESAHRALSHGCVRVDQPLRLGELVMGGAASGWTQERLRARIGGNEQTIFLPRPLAIHIEYFTAFVDDAGTMQWRDDLYGLTHRVADIIGS